MRRAVVALGIVAILGSSCGGRGELPTRLAASLQDRVATIRGFAENGRPGLARNALRNLVVLVTARLEAGLIDEGRAAEILEAAQDVAEELAHLPRPSPSDTPSPSPSEDGDGNGQRNSGKGKGNEGDEGHGNDD